MPPVRNASTRSSSRRTDGGSAQPPTGSRDLPPPGREHGYYGQPILKPPPWTWEVPLYFFAGGDPSR